MRFLNLKANDSDEPKDKFEKLYNTYKKQMMSLAVSILQNQKDAEDAVHDAFLIILSNMDAVDSIDDPTEVRGYVLNVVMNVSLDKIKGKQATEAYDADDTENCANTFEESERSDIKKRKNKSLRFTKKTVKRILLFAAVALTAAAAVIAIRTAVIKNSPVTFDIKTNNDEVDYCFKGNVTDKIEKEYEMKYIPDGFEMTECLRSDTIIYTEYWNDENISIYFRQNVTNDLGGKFNTTFGTASTIYVSGMEVHLWTSEVGASARWIQNRYFFVIGVNGKIEKSEIVKMIESVQPLDTADT